MYRTSLLRVIVVGLACIAVAGGCRSRGSRPEDDVLMPEALDGDYALGARFEDGERITDVQFDAVRFAYDSFQIENSEISKIEQVADYLGRRADVRLVVEGHCDERGSREYNMSLGEHRALAVRAYLIGLGIQGSRIQTRSYGEEMPVDSSHGESAWRANRRGEFALYR